MFVKEFFAYLGCTKKRCGQLLSSSHDCVFDDLPSGLLLFLGLLVAKPNCYTEVPGGFSISIFYLMQERDNFSHFIKKARWLCVRAISEAVFDTFIIHQRNLILKSNNISTIAPFISTT
jgi:hypothetical protein